MTALTINYTGRIDIEPQEIEATYRIDNDKYLLEIKWWLGLYPLGEDCKIFIEMRGEGKTTEARRFELGQLSSKNGSKMITLEQVRNPELVRIRFGVVASDANGIPLIKAHCDNIAPVNLNENNRSRSFLKMVKAPELVVPWRLEFYDGEPVLMISDREELFHRLRDTSPLFTPLVLSEVVRQVFEWIAFEDLDYTSKISNEWVAFFEQLTCPVGFIREERSRDDDEDFRSVELMSRVVSEEFSKKFRLIDAIASTFNGEGE